MRSFTFNTDSNGSTSALVVNALNPRSLSGCTVKLGEVLSVGLFLASPSEANGYDPRSGDEDYSVTASLGTPGAVPTAGSYTLSFGSQTTAALTYNATAAQIQTALTAISSIGANNVVVTGQFPSFNVQFVGALALAAQALIQVQSSLLSARSVVTVGNVQVGSGVQNAIQSITLQVLPAVYQSTWDTLTNGWIGTLDFSTAALFQLFTLGQPYINEILEFTFTGDGETFKYSCPITVNASVAAVTGSGTGIAPDSMSGTWTIGNGVSTGTVTGLGLATAPRGIEATVLTPAGGFVMAVTVDYSTITTDGFTFNLSGQTNTGTYRLFYTLIF